MILVALASLARAQLDERQFPFAQPTVTPTYGKLFVRSDAAVYSPDVTTHGDWNEQMTPAPQGTPFRMHTTPGPDATLTPIVGGDKQ